jgi:hypothetical protein
MGFWANNASASGASVAGRSWPFPIAVAQGGVGAVAHGLGRASVQKAAFPDSVSDGDLEHQVDDVGRYGGSNHCDQQHAADQSSERGSHVRRSLKLSAHRSSASVCDSEFREAFTEAVMEGVGFGAWLSMWVVPVLLVVAFVLGFVYA